MRIFKYKIFKCNDEKLKGRIRMEINVSLICLNLLRDRNPLNRTKGFLLKMIQNKNIPPF